MKLKIITKIHLYVDFPGFLRYIVVATKQKRLTNEREGQYGKQGTLWITDWENAGIP